MASGAASEVTLTEGDSEKDWMPLQDAWNEVGCTLQTSDKKDIKPVKFMFDAKVFDYTQRLLKVMAPVAAAIEGSQSAASSAPPPQPKARALPPIENEAVRAIADGPQSPAASEGAAPAIKDDEKDEEADKFFGKGVPCPSTPTATPQAFTPKQSKRWETPPSSKRMKIDQLG